MSALKLYKCSPEERLRARHGLMRAFAGWCGAMALALELEEKIVKLTARGPCIERQALYLADLEVRWSVARRNIIGWTAAVSAWREVFEHAHQRAEGFGFEQLKVQWRAAGPKAYLAWRRRYREAMKGRADREERAAPAPSAVRLLGSGRAA